MCVGGKPRDRDIPSRPTSKANKNSRRRYNAFLFLLLCSSLEVGRDGSIASGVVWSDSEWLGDRAQFRPEAFPGELQCSKHTSTTGTMNIMCTCMPFSVCPWLNCSPAYADRSVALSQQAGDSCFEAAKKEINYRPFSTSCIQGKLLSVGWRARLFCRLLLLPPRSGENVSCHDSFETATAASDRKEE